MNGTQKTLRGISLAACALSALFVTVQAVGAEHPGKQVAQAAGTETGHAEHAGHDDHAGHGHGPAIDPSVPLDERVSVPCEHDVPIYQCTECRYEVGVVKVDASLLKRESGGSLVHTQTVVRTHVVQALSTTGEVALNKRKAVQISPRVGGIIDTVPVDIGARVKAGDTLLTLTSVELGKALADFQRSRTLAELSEGVFSRETRLKEKKVASEQDVIDAQMDFEQHRADLRASEQTLHAFGLTEQDLAEMGAPPYGSDGGGLPIRAPIAGTIIEMDAAAGEMVEAGRALMLLADLSTVWVWANVQSRDLAPLLAAEKQGVAVVGITVTAFPSRQFDGRLDYIGATMDEKTRTIKVRVTVENPDLELRPGMFCTASIALSNGHAEEVLAVPRSAVLTDEGNSFVFTHWKNDFFFRQNVHVGRTFFGMVEILDGLQAGETVVTEGSFLLKSDVLREKMGAGCAD